MNPQVQQAIDNINAYIVENHNNEITANVLNPILIELANLFDIVGDLSDLNTADSDSVVSAINWALNQISTGISIHSGQANPNVTPPASFAVGDLYSRLDILENPYQIYIYNGAEWAEIRQAINDSIIGLDTTWSSEKISEAIQGDRFENVPTIDLVGNKITISNASWWIQGVNYNLSPDFEDTINYTSVAGMMRKDIIVAVTGNSMIRIQGDESDTNPSGPTVPPNTLLVTPIDVFHDSIGEPTVPIAGDNYIPKASQGWVSVVLNSAVLTFTPTINDKFSLNLTSFTSGHIIPGLNITTLANKIWAGGFFCIRTSGSYPITLEHLGSSGKIRFSFKGEEDFILTEDDGVLFFKLGVIPTTGNAIAYCLNAPSGSGDFIPLSGTEVGKPLTGEIEADTSNGNVGFYSDSGGVERRITMTDDGLNVIQNTDLNTNEHSRIGNTPQNTTIRTTDANNNKAEIVVGDYGTVTFNSVIPGDNFSGHMYYNAEEGLNIRDNNSTNYSGLWVSGIYGQYETKNWTITKDFNDSTQSQLFFPDSGFTPRRIPVSVNGNYANQQGDIELELTADNIDYDNTASGLLAETVQEAVDEIVENISKAGFVQRTGTAIAFDKWATYGTYASPVSGNLSYSFTNMVKGMIQVMYHEDTVAPTLTATGVTVIETGDYVVENINKITVHCIDENVVEVNIKAL